MTFLRRFGTSKYLSTSHKSISKSLVSRLQENKELDLEDARNELRWIRQSLPAGNEQELANRVDRRSRGEPLQYILGSTDFGPLNLRCRAPTLIPRPETADVFSRLAELLRTKQTSQKPISIIDLCTGSAPIALLLKHDLGRVANITGYDFGEKAIQLAKENIGLTGLDINVQQADILERDFVPTAIRENGGRVDLIVSNPPYIPQVEYDQLPASVKEWEDPAALLGDIEGGGTGLLFYERIAELLPDLLTSPEQLEQKGWAGIPRVAVEIGYQQGIDVSSIFRQGGMRRTEVWQDQFGTDRMVLGWDS